MAWHIHHWWCRGGAAKRRSGSLLLAVVLLAAAAPLGLKAAGAGGDSLEYEVKSAMLYNFTRFVEWPASAWRDARAALVVGVLGSDPFGKILDQTMQDKTYGGRPIRIRRLRSVSELEGCNLVFVARSEKKHLQDIVRAAQAANILTVSDMDEFVEAGGVIGFVLVDNKIRFEINAPSAAKAGLTVSSKLLRLATNGDRRGGGSQP